MVVVYFPPSEVVPIHILNGLHRHNRNLIPIGDLNARHPNRHDVTSHSCGRRLAELIDEKQNLKIFNSSQSTRSRAVIDLIITSSHVSLELAENDRLGNARNRSLSGALASIIVQIAQQY